MDLSNEFARIAFDENGCLRKLTNRKTGREYAGGGGLWRMIFSIGDDLENELRAEDVPVRMTKLADDSVQLEWDGEFPLSVTVRLVRDEVRLTPTLRNASVRGCILREFHFPTVRNVQLRPESELLWSFSGGEHHRDIPAMIDSGFTAYMALDNRAVERSILYPGHAALNAYFITEKHDSLYVASHDPSFQNTLHLLRKRGEEIDLVLVKYPFLAPGKEVSWPDFVLAPCSGDWRTGAKKYRAYADAWYHPAPVAESFRASNGWQRVILKHQYGRVMHHYSDLPKILKSGLKGDIDTLFLFGWFAEGHDSGYPEYHYDETQGGRDALKAQIASFQAGGGKVILYFNGHLIDKNTDFYRTTGKRISIKTVSLQEHQEFYNFSGEGTALRLYGNKVFVTACPACGEWFLHLRSLVDRAVDLGCDGVFFDQLGFTSRPCFDPSHGHPVPLMNPMAEKGRLVKRLREYIAETSPGMSLGIEWLTDPTSQYADYVHNIFGGAHAVNGSWERNGEKPYLNAFPALYRYIFPEIMTTDREIRDDTDIPRRVNTALVNGFRSDVEIHRCRGLLDDAPVYQAYLKQAGRLRGKYRSLILNGRFLEHDHLTCDNEALFYSLFSDSSRFAVVLTQAHLKRTSAVIRLDCGAFTEFDGIGDFSVELDGSLASVTLGKNALIVLVAEQNSAPPEHSPASTLR